MLRTLGNRIKGLLRFFVSISFTLTVGERFFRLLGMRPSGSLPELPYLQQILILRLDQIGDVVMTSALLRELRKNAPQARITLVVKPELRELVAACPYIDELLTFDCRTPKQFPELWRRSRALVFCLSHLWGRRFDLAIIPRWDVDSYYQTFLAYLSGASWRIGYSENINPIKQQLNLGYDRLLTHPIEEKTLLHEVERDLNILRALGGQVINEGLEIWTSPADEVYAQNQFDKMEAAGGGPVFALGPFVGGSSLKRWPLQDFVALGQWLQKTHGGSILILGRGEDQSEAQYLCKEIGCGAFSLAGQCSLPQTVALLKRCILYIGDDSGPMHLASAVGMPVIALFGPSCPHRFGPWTSNKQVLWKQLPCSPCVINNHVDCCSVCIFPQPQCIQSITLAEVQEAFEKQMPPQMLSSFAVG